MTAAFFFLSSAPGCARSFCRQNRAAKPCSGKTAAALTAIDQKGGKVIIDGEYWKAVSQTPVRAGRGG